MASLAVSGTLFLTEPRGPSTRTNTKSRFGSCTSVRVEGRRSHHVCCWVDVAKSWPSNRDDDQDQGLPQEAVLKAISVEISMFDSNVIGYKFIQDLNFFVTGGDDENELILATVLQGFVDAVSLILRSNVEKMEALENLDLILLCLDEIVDGGMILETDGNTIAGKVASHSMEDGASLGEQTISQALATAREHLTRSLLS